MGAVKGRGVELQCEKDNCTWVEAERTRPDMTLL